MSDEPQPQQPNEGAAPKEPLPAEGPGKPGRREETAGGPRGGKGEPGDTAGRPARAATGPAGPTRTGSGAGPGSAAGGTGAGAPDRTASVTRARQAARSRSEQPGAAGTGGPRKPDAPAGSGATGPDDAKEAGTGAKGSAGGASAPKREQPAESTQVLRRVTPPREPEVSASEAAKDRREPRAGRASDTAGTAGAPGKAAGAGGAPVPETTQVLRRVGAPRPAEPGGSGAAPAAKPDPAAGRTPRTSVPRPAGQDSGTGAAAKSTGAASSSPAAARAARAARAAGAAGAAGAAAGAAAQASPAGAAAGAGGAARTGAAEAPTTALAATGGPAAGDGSGSGSGGGDGGGKGKKGKRPRRSGWRRLLPTWRMVLGTFVVGVLLVLGVFVIGYSLVKIPSANAFATKQANVYLYADGSQIARDTRDSQVNRENVGLAEISKDAQHAVLAAEDRDFYTESAVDPKAMLRAGWNTATGKGKQSGSTITQQYVKNYYLGQEQTVTRKAKEFFISIKLDREKSKDEILEGYLNTSYFGRSAYGIQAAAQAYYGRDAADLDPARAAYLAALVNAPSEYDVVAHPENRKAAVARWNYVLDGMVKKGWLSESKRAGVKFPMPRQQILSTGLSGQRGYLVEAVRHYLITNKIVTADQLEAGGYRITTTIQKKKQNAFVRAVDDQLMAKLDKKNRKADTYVRAGGASVDPKTGEVVAMYGGVDYVKQYTNGATRGDFQVGSTFKPFVFTAAVENGSTTQDGRTITPNTIYDGTNKRLVQGWSGAPYNPENEDQKSYGPITVGKATDLSVNSVYAQMAADVGPAKVKQTAVDLGIPAGTPDLYPSPSMALGTANASVLDMAQAYATLANHGKHGTYTLIKKITKDGTEALRLPAQAVRQAVSREAADTTTSVLRSVVQSGTATAAQGAGRPAAGKTGTAESDTAAWFAGYTPDLATVVSVMGQDPVTAKHVPLYGALGVARMNGGGPPTQIWAQYTRDALKGEPAGDFDLRLQSGADQPQAPGTGVPTQPGTDAGQDTGGTATNGGTDGGGATATPGDGGTTGTPTDGGTATDGGGTPPTGGDTTGGGGTPTTGGGTTGGGGTTTGGGTPTGGGTTDGGGTATGGGGGGTAGGGGTPGGNTTGTDAGGGPGGFTGT